MKNFKFSTKVVSLSPLNKPVITVTPNGKTIVRTHKIALARNKQMDAIDAELGKFTNGQGNTLKIGVTNSNNHCVMQLATTFAQAIADALGVPLSLLPFVAKDATVNFNVELREQGDTVHNARTDEDIDITENQVNVTISEGSALTPQARMEAMLVSAQASLLASSFAPTVAPVATTTSTDEGSEEETATPAKRSAPRRNTVKIGSK